MPWEETEDYVRSAHKSTDNYDKDSMRTIVVSEEKGIKAIIGCPKGKFKDGKCTVGTEVLSYLFDKKEWTESKAKAWFEKQNRDK